MSSGYNKVDACQVAQQGLRLLDGGFLDIQPFEYLAHIGTCSYSSVQLPGKDRRDVCPFWCEALCAGARTKSKMLRT